MKVHKRKEENLMRLYYSGARLSDIADALHLSPSTVARIVRKHVDVEERTLDEWQGPGVSSANEQCRKCKYRATYPSDVKKITCDYILIKHEMRGCPVEGCTKFEEGKSVVKPLKIIVG